MKLVVALMLALACAACEQRPKNVRQCESLLLTKLKAPTTYRAFDTIVSPADGGKQQVAITYDAVNSYNAPIRGTFFCNFDVGSGLADEAEGVAASFDEAPSGQSDLPGAAPPSPTDRAHTMPSPRVEVDPSDEIPVCDQPDSPEKFALMNEIGTDCTGE